MFGFGGLHLHLLHRRAFSSCQFQCLAPFRFAPHRLGFDDPQHLVVTDNLSKFVYLADLTLISRSISLLVSFHCLRLDVPACSVQCCP